MIGIPAATGKARVEVVAAVIERPEGDFLLAERPAGKVYAGYWEFPGGKVEPGESAQEALARELHEELGIEVTCAYPWIIREFDYEHADVRLRFFRVTGWNGTPRGREMQRLAWQHARKPAVSPMLPANGPILRALSLPRVYGITNAVDTGVGEFMDRLDAALSSGLRMLQIRERGLDKDDLMAFATDVVARAHEAGANVLVNGDVEFARAAKADGVHLSSTALMRATARPLVDLVGASCHDSAELAHAAALGVDFVVLGPVAATPSHPDAVGLGWKRFGDLVSGSSVPVYALGGMTPASMKPAWTAGAHGIAMMRGAWTV